MISPGVPEEVLGEILDELVVRGSDDWVMLVEVDASVVRATARARMLVSSDARIGMSMEVLHHALGCGLMVAGDVIDRAGFQQWKLSAATSLERIGREWRAAGASLQMGDICWFANTTKGETRAERVRDTVNARADWRAGA
jgi:hypothetical protein